MTIESNIEIQDRKKDGNVTREEILYAAARLIVEHGYGACTMRSVSERVRIKAGSLYYHFASKDEIVAEIMNLGVSMLWREVELQVRALPPGSSFKKRLDTAIRAHVAAKTNPQTPLMQVYEHLPPVLKRQAKEMRQKYSNFWIKLLSEGVASGDIRSNVDLTILVSYLLGGLNRIPEWYRAGKKDDDKVAKLISSTIMNGILASRKSSAASTTRSG